MNRTRAIYLSRLWNTYHVSTIKINRWQWSFIKIALAKSSGYVHQKNYVLLECSTCIVYTNYIKYLSLSVRNRIKPQLFNPQFAPCKWRELLYKTANQIHLVQKKIKIKTKQRIYIQTLYIVYLPYMSVLLHERK